MYKINKLQGYIGEHRENSFREKDPSSSDGKESPCNAGDLALILGSGRSPGGENGNPHHGVTKSWTQLTDWLTTPLPAPQKRLAVTLGSLSHSRLDLSSQEKPAAMLWEGPRRRPMWVNLKLDLLRLPHAQEAAQNEVLLQARTEIIAADTLTPQSLTRDSELEPLS